MIFSWGIIVLFIHVRIGMSMAPRSNCGLEFGLRCPSPAMRASSERSQSRTGRTGGGESAKTTVMMIAPAMPRFNRLGEVRASILADGPYGLRSVAEDEIDQEKAKDADRIQDKKNLGRSVKGQSQSNLRNAEKSDRPTQPLMKLNWSATVN
jgi:hypothetical protein